MSEVPEIGVGNPGIISTSQQEESSGRAGLPALAPPACWVTPARAGILDGGRPSVSWAGTGERQSLQGRPQGETRGPGGLPLDCGRERGSGQYEDLTSPGPHPGGPTSEFCPCDPSWSVLGSPCPLV